MQTDNSTPQKICKICKHSKSLTDFGKNSRQKDLHHYYCKQCITNLNEAKKEEQHLYFKEYRKKNKKRLNDYHQEYQRKRKEEAVPELPEDVELKKQKKRDKERERRSSDDYKSSRSFYFKMKYQTDTQYRLKKQFESKLNRLLNNINPTEDAVALIGCTIPQFKDYLASKWLPTMGWDNYGTEWQLDRITPFCSFDLSNDQEAAKCFHYTNVQPMFIQTKVVDGVEYVGNMNKNKFQIFQLRD